MGELGRSKKIQQGYLGQLGVLNSSEKNILVCITVKL
jgi:hypothetical protein